LLVIHIGSPKTGTTALQGFLKSHLPALRSRGLSYVAAGRTNIAHNSMVQPMLKGRAGDMVSALREEIAAAPDMVHVLSSEVFFQPAMAPRLAEAVDGLCRDLRVVAYLRRPDRYAEAMYKQKVKNGRIPPDPSAFLEGWAADLRYMPVIDAYREAFGEQALRVRPFRRSHFPQGDVIADFAEQIGGVDLSGLARPDTPSNKTLSRAVSEHLGRVNRHTPFNSRVMIREIAAEATPGTLRGGDVFDKHTRARIMENCAQDLASVSAACFEGVREPFDLSDLAPDAPDLFPGPEEALRLERAAAEAVMAALGRQAAKPEE